MDKSEFMYRYIDECMYPYCLDIILKENYRLKDDSKVYASLVRQFLNIMDKFSEKADNKEDDEEEELLANVRQKILKKIAEDVDSMFKGMATNELKTKMMEEKLNDDFFLKLSRDLRDRETGKREKV